MDDDERYQQLLDKLNAEVKRREIAESLLALRNEELTIQMEVNDSQRKAIANLKIEKRNLLQRTKISRNPETDEFLNELFAQIEESEERSKRRLRERERWKAKANVYRERLVRICDFLLQNNKECQCTKAPSSPDSERSEKPAKRMKGIPKFFRSRRSI